MRGNPALFVLRSVSYAAMCFPDLLQTVTTAALKLRLEHKGLEGPAKTVALKVYCMRQPIASSPGCFCGAFEALVLLDAV